MERDDLERLSDLLAVLDVPARRRDVEYVDNLVWLDRNLQVHNSDREQFHEALWLVRVLLDERDGLVGDR